MEKIIPVNTGEQFRSDYQRYAVYVEYSRIMSDIRDGLKPVQRRIIYDMLEIGATTSFTKSANVVGNVMAKYHPHGSTYTTMTPMGNWFECYMPLITPQGNFGTIQGNPPAAYRYTECHLSPFALECVVGDLREAKEAVDWSPNYANTCMEPDYLPVAVPLLLINGSFGIGVGKRIDIPSHNINEVIDATLALIQNPNQPITLIPDMCTSCEIFDDANWEEISQTGFGYFTVRGVTTVENDFTNDLFKHRPAVIIKSTPNLTNLTSIVEQIEALVAKKKIVQIDPNGMLDQSDGDKMRFVLVLKPGSDPEYVRNVIYQNTDLQKTVRVNFEMLNGLEPLRISYRDYLLFFIENRKKVKYRVFINRLRIVETRIHEKDAFIKLLESGKIDEIIEKIRKYKNDEAGLVEYLIKLLNITDLQAKFIINANLKSLTVSSLKKLKDDVKNLMEMREEFLRLVTDEHALTQYIAAELMKIKEKYGCPRKCKLIHKPNAKDAIPRGGMYVAITEKGFIKKVPIGTSLGNIRNDSVKMVIEMDNADNLILFDSSGKVFKLPIHKLPFSDRNSNGIDLRFIIKGSNADVVAAIPEEVIKKFRQKNKSQDRYNIVTLTSQGLIKKMELDEFLSITSAGLSYIKLDQGDKVISILFCYSKDDVLVFDDKKVMRIPIDKISTMKRAAKGNHTLRSDHIDGMTRVDHSIPKEHLIVVTQHGRVNKIPLGSIPGMGTVKKEFSVIRLGKNDSIQNILLANDTENLVIRCFGMDEFTFQVMGIPIGSSITSGDKVLSVKNSNIIYSYIK